MNIKIRNKRNTLIILSFIIIVILSLLTGIKLMILDNMNYGAFMAFLIVAIPLFILVIIQYKEQ